MKLPKKKSMLTFTAKNKVYSCQDSVHDLIRLCNELPPEEAAAVSRGYVEMSKQLFAKEQELQQLALSQCSSYLPRQILSSYFTQINEYSHRYQIRAMEIAQIYALCNRPLDSHLKRIGDNCYEFAMGDLFDNKGIIDDILDPGFTLSTPGKYWLGKAWQPQTQRVIDDLTKEYQYYMNKATENGINKINLSVFPADLWWKCMNADANYFGKKLTRVEFHPDTYVAKPNTILLAGVYYSEDYHYYRYEPSFRYWAHKRGVTPVTAFDNSGKLIKYPHPKMCDCGKYDQFMGFFELSNM